MPRYRVCKTFEVESGHMLSKHAGRCRFPHGHTRRVEVVLSRDALDKNDMVCDFKALKRIMEACLDQFDHAMAINSNDPLLPSLLKRESRVVIFHDCDPTTEVIAKFVFDAIQSYIDPSLNTKTANPDEQLPLPQGIALERVRVWETSTSWGEYGL